VYSIYRAFLGYYSNSPFLKADNLARHWTATIAHIQLILGIIVYSKSPIIVYFFANQKEALQHTETYFFAIVHLVCMLTAIILITIGSALTKRKPTDKEKFKTQFYWFCIALIIILIAIPWPFSPLANRPYIRIL
jgi:cell division protein FtsW (lipid II flippase)